MSERWERIPTRLTTDGSVMLPSLAYSPPSGVDQLIFDKLVPEDHYLRQVLAPPRDWLAAHLQGPPHRGLWLAYLRQRRREGRDWDRITRRDELLGGQRK